MAGQPEYETDIRMLSKWLIFASDDVKKETPRIASKLNNVAFVVTSHIDGGKPCSVDENIFKILKRVLNHLQCPDEDGTTKGNTVSRFSEILQMYRTRIEKQILETDISTLLLQPDGRQYKAIDTVKNYLYNRHVTRELFPNIHYGFNGREFSVATIESQPFVFKAQTGHGENVSVTYSGYCIDLLAELANLLNFTYTLTEPEDRQWGMRNPDGNWTGLVGLLQRKEVDLVVASLSKDKRREKVMDFSYPFFYEYVGGIMKKPDPDKEKWKTYFYPFSWEVYIMILILLPVTSLFLCLFEKYNPFYRFQNRKNKEGLHRFRDSFWFVLGALLSQGGIHRPASITGRTMVSFFCLFSIIMLALYSGNLIAFLAVSKDNHPFDSLKELLKQNDYTWGTLNGTLWVTMFNESTDPTHKAVWNKMVETAGSDPAVLSGDNDVHLDKVRDGQYMYIGDYTQFENIMRNTSKCDLILMKEKFFPNQFGIGLQKDSPYKDLFSEKVMEISESGLPAMWKQKWWAKSAFCSGTSVAESKKIKLVDIQSAFYLVVIGIAIALLTLIGEKLACNVVLPQTTSRRF